MSLGDNQFSHLEGHNFGDAKVGIVRSTWNSDITQSLFKEAHQALTDKNILSKNIFMAEVPGSYELVFGAMHLIKQFKVEAVICLGCVIKGETNHDEYINHSVANGLQQLTIQTEIPCVFGVVTTNTLQQAIDRSNGTHGNKGRESALTALSLIAMQ